jgi:LytS/YehU family sensor histidine kinase
MSGSLVGLLIGLALGIIWVLLGFGAALLCAVLTLVGWFVGAVAQGKINLTNVWRSLQEQRRT